MARNLQPIIIAGVIDGFAGLEEGEEVRIIPYGLVADGILEESFADWLFDNEPLKGKVVLVVAAQNDKILRHRANFEVEFGEPIQGKTDRKASVAELHPKHPNAEAPERKP